MYETGKAVVYDTTYSHYTKNTNSEEERIVLHIDFWYELLCTIPPPNHPQHPQHPTTQPLPTVHPHHPQHPH